MRLTLAIATGLVFASCAAAAADPSTAALPNSDELRARAIVATVDPAELHATIEKLVSFGTRHTMSDTVSDTRGIGAARRWVAAEFAAMSRDCGGCLSVETPSEVFT